MRELYMAICRLRQNALLPHVSPATRDEILCHLDDAQHLFTAQLPRTDLLRYARRTERWQMIAALDNLSERARDESVAHIRHAKLLDALRIIEDSIAQQ